MTEHKAGPLAGEIVNVGGEMYVLRDTLQRRMPIDCVSTIQRTDDHHMMQIDGYFYELEVAMQ